MGRLLSEKQFSAASFMAAAVDDELDQRLRLLEELSRQITPALLRNPAALQTLLEQRPILPIQFNSGAFIVGVDGVAIASLPLSVKRVGVNYMDRDFIVAALKKGKATVGAPVIGKQLHAPIFVIGAPIRDASGVVIGALAGVTDLSTRSFLDKISDESYRKNGSYYLLVSKPQLLIVTSNDKNRIMTKLVPIGTQPKRDRFLQGQDGSSLITNSLGVEVLSSFKKLSQADWVVVVTSPTSEAFAPIHAMQRRMLLAASLLTLLAGVLIWWVVRRQLAPMLAAMSAVNSMPDKMVSLPVTSQDEIGQLIGAFNRLLETIEQNNELLERTGEMAKVGGWELDLATTRVTYSKEVARIHEFDLPHIPPMLSQGNEYYPPEAWPIIHAAVQAAIEHGTAYDLESPFITAKGRHIWVRVQGVAVRENGKTIKLRGTLQDITERKVNEEKLRNERNFIESLIETSPVGITTVDSSGRLTFANSKAIEILGLSNDLITQTTYNSPKWQITDLDGNPFPDDRLPFTQVMSSGMPVFDIQHTIQQSDGKRILLSINGAPILDAAGNVTTIVFSVEDISKRKQAEKDLQHAKAAAESANTAKSQFLANMSHEIRTPMNGVLGMAQLLELTELSEEQQEYVAALKLSGNLLMALLNDILDLSRIEAGKVDLELSDFSLKHSINDSVLMQKSALNAKSLKLIVTHAEDIPRVLLGDQRLIKQILLNLLGNAVKFTARGSVSLSTRLLERNDTSVLVQIAVRDIGISPEALDLIFKPFAQEDSSTTRVYGGTGLGLSISRRLAELMGGSIAVESTQEVGSCFTITLPLSIGSGVIAPREDTSITTVTWDGPPLRILFVEDDPMNIAFGKSLFNKLGLDFIAAVNGRECLTALERGTFDLVLMDIQMPVMNGEEALLEIRSKERESGSHLPVIAVTAHSMRGDKMRFLELGFDGYVSKPLTSSGLVEEMKRVKA